MTYKNEIFNIRGVSFSTYRLIGIGIFLLMALAPFFSPMIHGNYDPNIVTWLLLGAIFFVLCEIAHKSIED